MQIRTVVFCIFFSYIHCKLIDLSCQDIRKFVDGHNKKRLRIARGEVDKQPAAGNMQSLVWDRELAAKAAKWASKYRDSHNPDTGIASQRFDRVGENLHWYTTTDRNYKFSPAHPLLKWFEEHNKYHFGYIKQDPNKDTLHYTQMAWAQTTHVGCAVSKFHDEIWDKYFVVCYYGPGGNVAGVQPYKTAHKLNTRELQCQVDACQHPYGKHCPVFSYRI